MLRFKMPRKQNLNLFISFHFVFLSAFPIFAKDRMRLSRKFKQVWFSVLDFHYLCND